MKLIQDGDLVRWELGHGFATGKVEQIYPVKATCHTDGYQTTRHGSLYDPVLKILTGHGGSIVKLASEVQSMH